MVGKPDNSGQIDDALIELKSSSSLSNKDLDECISEQEASNSS